MAYFPHNQGLDSITAGYVRGNVAGIMIMVRRGNVLYVNYQPVVRGRGTATVRQQPGTGSWEVVGAPIDFFEGTTIRLLRVGNHVPATYTHGDAVVIVDDFVAGSRQDESTRGTLETKKARIPHRVCRET